MAAKTDNFQSPDYFNVDELLTEEHKLVRESVRNYVKKEISPIIEDYAQRAEFPQQIVKQMGELGVFGPTIPEQYGGGGLDYISYGLMMQELERGDSGVRSTASVQGSLVMFPIYQYGSEEQRNKYLPKLASGEWLGCFGLTEPNHGSDPSSMLTNIKDAGDHVILNGAKMWISNAPFSQVAVVWAKDEAGDIRGLVVERGMEGFSTPTTHGKWSLRASATGELVFDNVKVKKFNKRIDHDAKAIDGNKPDFVLFNGEIPILYIEAKDIGVSLDKIENSDQMRRYYGYANLVLTDYIEFRFYRNGIRYQDPIKIAENDKKHRTISAIPSNFEHVAQTLIEFIESYKEPIKSGAHLSKIMAGKAQRIRDNVKEYLKEGTEIAKVYEMLKKLLVSDLSIDSFADMYAQTLVYGLFAARYNDESPESFTRQEARDLIPQSKEMMRVKLFSLAKSIPILLTP